MTQELFDFLRFRCERWQKGHERWELLNALTAGGEFVTPEIKRKLLINPTGRSAEVIEERVKCSTYINKIGPQINRMAALLFKEDAAYESIDEFGEKFLESGAILKGKQGRSSFFQLLQEAMRQGWIEGAALVQIDRRISSGAQTLAQQQQSGELEPYAVLLPRECLWDWDTDDSGFKFTKIHRFKIEREAWNKPPKPVHDFTIHQRQDDGRILVSRYLISPAIGKKEFDLDTAKLEDIVIETELEEKELFNFNGVYKFPIILQDFKETQCIASQLLELQSEFFRVRSAVDWKFQQLYEMPVIIGGDTIMPGQVNDEENVIREQTYGDGYVLRLPDGYSLGTLSNETETLPLAIEFMDRIDKDVSNLMNQIAADINGNSLNAQSGESKIQDRVNEAKMLETFGIMVKELAIDCLEVAAIAAGTIAEPKVTGFEDIAVTSVSDILLGEESIGKINIQSSTFTKIRHKGVVSKYVATHGLDATELTKINQEIETADYGTGREGSGTDQSIINSNAS